MAECVCLDKSRVGYPHFCDRGPWVDPPPATEKYDHHGTEVTVLTEVKGQHRQHCLCFKGCKFFKPDSKDNCEIAEAVFKTCVNFHLVTPVYECPKYER